MSYAEFLARKTTRADAIGPVPGEVSSVLYPFQRAIVSWAVRRGRAAIFSDCGTGKTLMQLEWSRHVGNRALIVAPLAVTRQTEGEAEKLGMTVRYVTAPEDGHGVFITNYQRLHEFVGSDYDAIVLDESSILKSLDGSTRRMLIEQFTAIPYRLCCTATPAPNDLVELGNHAEFLGVLTNREMSASFFVKESNGTAWRLKGYAADAFYKWMASWSVYIRRPSDLGFDDDGFILPPLTITEEQVHSDVTPAGRLFPGMDPGIQGRLAARRASKDTRVARSAEIIGGTSDQWLVWCGLNEEGRALHRALNGESVLVEGSMSDEEKIAAAGRWIGRDVRVLISKPSIFGFGMNFQHCHNQLFLGLGDSYEQYYQAIRRSWRFGQESPVDVRIVTTEAEYDVVRNVRRKEEQAARIAEEVVLRMRDYEREEVIGGTRTKLEHTTEETRSGLWTMMLGDSVERIREIDADSVGLSVFSPPFVSLYTYSATERDIGNSRTEDIFFEHFRYIIDGLMAATMPGRLCCVHVSQIPAMIVRDGYIGLKDFRGRCITEYESRGWIYHGEVAIDKNPQAQAIRTKSKGLLFVQLKKDSSWLRPALLDYILVFRKPGDNPARIVPDVSNEEWIKLAHGVWYDIRETHTLNYREARSDKDERHICPLQLDVIERCIRLWSNPGDLVCSPFAGIGSEGYVAVRHNRRFIGCELKPEYYRIAVQNLGAAERETMPLFADGQALTAERQTTES